MTSMRLRWLVSVDKEVGKLEVMQEELETLKDRYIQNEVKTKEHELEQSPCSVTLVSRPRWLRSTCLS